MFKSFDNLLSMLAAVDVSVQEADELVRPWQARIKPGDFFVMQAGVLIYGEVLDPSVRQPGSRLTEEELQQDARSYQQPHMQHFRATKSYSCMCPEGEFGDQHVATIGGLLSKQLFEKCKEAGWPQEAELLTIAAGDSEL